MHLFCCLWLWLLGSSFFNWTDALLVSTDQVFSYHLWKSDDWLPTFECRYLNFPGGSEGKLQCRRPRFNPWVGKNPWKREWQPSPIFLPEEIHGQRSLQSMGSQRVEHDQVTNTTRLVLTRSVLQNRKPLSLTSAQEWESNLDKMIHISRTFLCY